jgi:hypothetical protein
MKSLLDRIVDLLKSKSKNLSIEERWLAQSTTLEEVERRQRMILRGQAPWQKLGGLY